MGPLERDSDPAARGILVVAVGGSQDDKCLVINGVVVSNATTPEGHVEVA